MNWKKEWKKFTSDAPGKMLVFLLVLGVICVIFMFWALSWF